MRRIILPSFALEPLGFWSRPSTFQVLALLTVVAAIAVFLRCRCAGARHCARAVRRLAPEGCGNSPPLSGFFVLHSWACGLPGLLSTRATPSTTGQVRSSWQGPQPGCSPLCTAGLIVLLPDHAEGSTGRLRLGTLAPPSIPLQRPCICDVRRRHGDEGRARPAVTKRGRRTADTARCRSGFPWRRSRSTRSARPGLSRMPRPSSCWTPHCIG